MRSGELAKIVNEKGNEGLMGLEGKTVKITNISLDHPSFYLVEMQKPSAAKQLGGWSGVAISGSFLRPLV